MAIKTAYDVDMEQIFSMIPELPEDIDQWIDENPMLKEQYFFTYRTENMKYGFCTHCKTESPVSPELYRTVDEKVLQNYRTKHNQTGTCPNCGRKVTFKDDGRGRKYLIKFGYFTIAQPLSDGGVMFRSFYVRKLLGGDYRTAQNELSEHIRIYYNEGIAACCQRGWSGCFIPQQGDYYEEYSEYYAKWYPLKKVAVPNPHRGNTYQNESFGMACLGFSDRELKDTVLKYACVDRAMNFLNQKWYSSKEDIVKYLELYTKMPVLVERLMKQGFEKIVFEKALNKDDSRGIINWNKQDAAAAFKGLTKNELKLLAGKSIRDLAIHQLCTAFKASVKARQWIEKNVDNTHEVAVLKKRAGLVSLNKFIKYMRAQTKKHFISIGDYADYINQCKQLNLDLTNAFILFPQDFQKAHSENTQLLTEIKERKEVGKLKEQDKAFEKRYKILCKKYAFETENLFIRPASGKAELMIEGKTLNHCVYTNYADSYISGKTLICVIREKEKPEKPFYTLEFNPRSGSIIQCRGYSNCAMTTEVKILCDLWKESLTKKKNTVKKETLRIGA